MKSLTYFLGANSAGGFYSCYDSFCAGKCDFLYVIKSGPGSGKSTFLRKLKAAAQKKGYETETVLCSGDPDSLDGVYIPKLHLGVVDGTAPHVIEPSCPGANSIYLDFSPYYDLQALQSQRESLPALFGAYKAVYADAYQQLSCFVSSAEKLPIPKDAKKRFNTALCCKGILRLDGLNGAKIVSEQTLSELMPNAAIVYLNPLFPSKSEGLITQSGEAYRIELALPDCLEVTDLLAKAKALHDELEQAYHPFIDFSGISTFTENWISSHLELSFPEK